MSKTTFFTSESVTEGHPDKIADQISDAILDEVLKQDPQGRVACETFIKMGMVLIGGEMTTHAWVDIDTVVRNIIEKIGYTEAIGFGAQTCAVLTNISKQSPDIAQGVDSNAHHEQGAGDQGLMFGYASNETNVFMPIPIVYAHLLCQRQAFVRKQNILPWLRPDGKSQVTFEYRDNQPIAISSIVFSTQHDPDIAQNELIEAVMETIIKPTIPSKWLTKNTQYLINPTGRFVIGGPQSDCGLTGRKIIVDTYGAMARHGGGCMSGKDATKVDRCASYAARYVAKNIVAAGLADKCEIQVSYAIGVAKPTSISIETFGTAKIPEEKIMQLINTHFDLRPKSIIDTLDLLKPLYLPTATYGHFGREDIEFNWEKTDKVNDLINDLKEI